MNTNTDADLQTANEPMATPAFELTFGTMIKTGPETYEVQALLGTAHDEATAALLTARFKNALAKNEGHAVEVVAVDERKYRCRSVRSNDTAKSVEVGRRFANAMEASRHMGYANNQVANRLGKARRGQKDNATICGVTLKAVKHDGEATGLGSN